MFNVVYVGGPAGPDESDTLLPNLTDDLDVAFDEHDGEITGPINFSAFSVHRRTGDKFRQFTGLSESKIQLYITDARVVLYCRKYDKGGGWSGGAMALAFNAGSKLLAANRSKGSALVGQLRFPWIYEVAFSVKQSFGTCECIRLYYRDNTEGDKQSCFIDLDLDKQTDAAAVAQDLIGRIARYRLKYDEEMDEVEGAQWSALTDPVRGAKPAKGRMTGTALPTSFNVPKGISHLERSEPAPTIAEPAPDVDQASSPGTPPPPPVAQWEELVTQADVSAWTRDAQ